MKKIYLLLIALVATVAASAQCTTDLFFSEYIEGSGNEKAMEIYNPTGASIDLTGYVLYRFNNGSSIASDSLFPQGMIASNDVFVIGNASATLAKIIAEKDTNHTYTFYNGDDALMLMKKTTRDTLDVFGVIGNRPSPGWAIKGATTANSTLVRNYSVQQGVSKWDTAQWAVFATDYVDNLGMHKSSCFPPQAPTAAATAPTADAAKVKSIYSETYDNIAGTNLYPNWSQTTTFSVFEIGADSMIKYSNLNYQGVEFGADVDASTMDFLHLDVWTPNVANLNVYPISRTTAEKFVTKTLTAGQWNTIDIPLTDFTSQSLSITDLFQFKFVDPDGNNGTVFIDNMYFYASGPAKPTTAAADPTAEQRDVISLFSNVYTNVTVDTWKTGWSQADLADVKVAGNDVKKYTNLNFVGVETVAANSIDASNMEYFTFDAWTPDATTYKIKLVDFGADNAFQGGDDSEFEIAFENPTQEAWTNHKIDLDSFTALTGKAHISQIIFSAVPSGSSILYIDNVYFSKNPTYTVSDIADVIMLDADLAATNKDELYEVTGVVYGVDLDGNAGLSFTIIDATAGINIFNFNDVNDYVVTEGDEITVRGKIDFYRGLLELVADSIKVNSAGNTLKAPTEVAAPSEATESDFIKLAKVWITNDTTTVWPDNGNVWLTNEAKDTFQIRIDRDIPGIVGMPVAFDTMVIVGLGGQFDATAPYNSGYQIFPRKLGDITEWVKPNSISDLYIKTNVYPNPTSQNLTVVGVEKWNTFEVYSIMGVKVSEGTLYNNNLSVSSLANGTYILKLQNADKEGVARFAVSK